MGKLRWWWHRHENFHPGRTYRQSRGFTLVERLTREQFTQMRWSSCNDSDGLRSIHLGTFALQRYRTVLYRCPPPPSAHL